MNPDSGSPDIPTLLDEGTLADLYEDFESTGDLSELAALIRKFVVRASEQLNAIAAAVHGGDAEPIRRAAHRLKGSSRTLGASLVGAVAARIEALAAEGDILAARETLPELESVMARSQAALSDVAAALDRDEAPASASRSA